MNDVLAKVIVAIVMLGVVGGIAVPVLRLRGRSAWPEPVGGAGPAAGTRLTAAPPTTLDPSAAAVPLSRFPGAGYRLSRIAVAAVLLGQLAAWIGLFLPAFTVPAVISQGLVANTLIQHSAFQVVSVIGVGVLLVCAVGLCLTHRYRTPLGLVLLPLEIMAASVHLLGGSTAERVLDGHVDRAVGTVHTSAGLGVVFVFFGAAVAGIGLVAAWATALPVGSR